MRDKFEVFESLLPTFRSMPLILATLWMVLCASSTLFLHRSQDSDSGIHPRKCAAITRRLGKTAIILRDLQAGRILASSGMASEAVV